MSTPSSAKSPRVSTPSSAKSPRVSTSSSAKSPRVSTPSSAKSPRVSTPSSTKSPRILTSHLASHSGFVGTKFSPQKPSESIAEKVLILPQATTKGKSGQVAVSRVLTSIENLNMLEEKERKKKQLAEEKEWRKKVREENRRKKEENMKLKAEEQARKLAEKARKSKRVQATKENQENQTLPVKKNIKSTVINNNDTTYACNINGDQCCMCLGSYAEDVREGNGRVADVQLRALAT